MSRLTKVRALRKLDKFFAEHPDINLRMSTFSSIKSNDGWWYDRCADPQRFDVHDCNSAACGVGWGPTAGLTKHLEAVCDWEDYSNLTFFNKAAKEDREFLLTDRGGRIWMFLFAGFWSDRVDGLRERLQFVIDYDAAPDGWEQQLNRFHVESSRELMERHREETAVKA